MLSYLNNITNRLSDVHYDWCCGCYSCICIYCWSDSIVSIALDRGRERRKSCEVDYVNTYKATLLYCLITQCCHLSRCKDQWFKIPYMNQVHIHMWPPISYYKCWDIRLHSVSIVSVLAFPYRFNEVML